MLAPGAGADGTGLAESLWSRGADPGAESKACGAYAEPPAPAPDAEPGAVVATADRLTREGAVTTLSGNARVREGTRQLAAPVLVIDEDAGTAAAPGVARLSDRGLHLRGSNVRIDMGADEATLESAEFVLADLSLRGTAERIARGAEALDLTGASITGCPPGDRAWSLRADRIDIGAGKPFATARDARVYIGGVPFFRTPYIRFPVTEERQSGWLFPELGHGGDGGFELALPYYLNLAPNYDATVVPRAMTRRGAGIDVEARHKTAWGDSSLNSAWLARDRRYNGTVSRRDWLRAGMAADEFAPDGRYLVRLTHRGAAGGLRTLVDYAAVSDKDYLADFGHGAGPDRDFASRISLPSRAEASYARGALIARLWAQDFEPLDAALAPPWRRLPEANLVHGGAIAGPLEWSFASAWSLFDHADPARVTGRRLHLEPGLRLPLLRPWGFLNLSTAWRYTSWRLANSDSDPRPRRDVQRASIDGGLIFERSVDADGPSRGWIQTLEPRLAYVYQSYAAQAHLPRFDAALLTFGYRQLFRPDRFAGLDRLGDANQIAVGIATRLIEAKTGRERLQARIGTIAHLADRRVTLSGRPRAGEKRRTSPVAADVLGRVGAAQVVATAVWDPYDGDFDEAGVFAAWRSGAERLLSVGYRRRVRHGIDQTDIGFHTPLTDRVSVFGRWNHDWENGQMVEGFAGFGWTGCCLSVKVLWRRLIDAPRHALRRDAGIDVRPEDRIMVQVALNGLASLGTRIESHLERGVKGYRRGR